MSSDGKEAIKVVLDQHYLWIESGGKQGTRADLSCADLRGADLYGSDLRGAYLEDANLENANLKYACLYGTILEEKQEKVSEETGSPSNLRAKFDELAKSLGLEIVSLTVKRSETFSL